MEQKPIPPILSEEDEPSDLSKEKRDNSLAACKAKNAFWLRLGELCLKAAIQYFGLVLVAIIFWLFYKIISKENFLNQESINQFFEIGKAAILLILGYMFGNRKEK